MLNNYLSQTTRIVTLKPGFVFGLCLLFGQLTSCQTPSPQGYDTWGAYAGAKDGNRYSTNQQITPANVTQLKMAWSYSSKDKDPKNGSQDQCNPIMVHGVLYGVSPKLKLFALNAATGAQKWIFDPAKEEKSTDPYAFFKVSRGVVYWQNEAGDDKRILYSAGSKLYAINVADGSPIRSFGKNGSIELKENLDYDKKDFYLVGTSPGVVYKDQLIVGMRIAGAPGHIRSFDIRTGKRKWIFHVIPQPGEVGYDSWKDKNAWKKFGEANCWAGMSLDEKRGIVYIPTGSANPDFYGGTREGKNLFGCSLIALNAATGKYIWHYQVVHHDLWDRDMPANPNLITLSQNGKKIDAVAQITKNGYIYVFDRVTGKPVFPINEVPVPTNALPGEHPWPTQPIPTLPKPFVRQHFDSSDVTNLDAATHLDMMARYKKIKHKAPFTPPSKDGSWIFPGFDGGGEWGGAAVDIETQIMYVNASELPWFLVMIDVPKNTNDVSIKGLGHAIYNRTCIGCHGGDLKGNGTTFPSLQNIEKKYNEQQLTQIITNGRNMMPAFKQLSEPDRKALTAFLLNLPEKEAIAPVTKSAKSTATTTRVDPTGGPDNIPYTMNGWNRFQDKNGYPGIKPPWGTLNAVNLNTGKLLWKVPLGEYPELTKKGIPVTGTENYGGPLVTKGGLVFIGASKDEKLHAYDKKTGKLLWEAKLPAAGFATPATYTVDGKQYVVIACGGGKIGNKSGDEYVAFALP